MAKYLVTGGAGFIGSHMSQVLLNKGHQVVVVDNVSTGYESNVPTKALFINRACQDESLYRELEGERFDAILHFAGQSSGEVSFDDPVYDLRTNTESTLRLAQFALSNGCNRFLYASSMSVYGTKPDRPVEEDEVLQPLSFYGVGKIASEQYLRIYESQGLRHTSFRLFNVYGPGQNLANMRQGMISIYLQYLLQGDRITVKGSLERFRDFIYVDDVVNTFSLAIDDERFHDQVLNLGTGVKTDLRTLLQRMCECFGIQDYRSVVDVVGGTPGDQFGIFASTSKLKETGATLTRTSLRVGLTAMVDWAKTLGVAR